jgi:hypothetical protein
LTQKELRTTFREEKCKNVEEKDQAPKPKPMEHEGDKIRGKSEKKEVTLSCCLILNAGHTDAARVK